jgi:hypothetical protein
VGTPKDFGVYSADQSLRGITAAGRECLSGDLSETGNVRQSAHLRDEELQVVLNCMGTTQSICCRDHTNMAVSAGTGFCTYVDWDLFAHLGEYYTPLKPVTPFFNTLYKEE